MLDHRPIRAAFTARPPEWPGPPCMAGDWREVPLNVLATLTAEAARREDRGRTPLPSPVDRMRALPLPFYGETMLVEGLACYSPTADGVFRMLLEPSGFLLLDGESPMIHELNLRQLRLEDDEALVDRYLRFYAGSIRGGKGPFRIVEKLDDLVLDPALDPETRRTVAQAVRPMEPVPSVSGFRRNVCVVYACNLFQAEFHICESGTVRMTDDNEIAMNAVADRSYFDGIWQVFEHATPDVARIAKQSGGRF